MKDTFITLAHGAGGEQTAELIDGIFKKYFSNSDLTADDAAVVNFQKGKLACSTDSFIVSPAFFSGGNIGKLSICGTVNDLACMGAKPLYLTAAFIIEEGFEMSKLEQIASSMAETAAAAGVRIISGDTKVAGKGQVDGIFINTTGIGIVKEGTVTGGALVQDGDDIIVTGNIGQHGATILLARNDFGIQADVKSDCAPLWNIVNAITGISGNIHTIRDATRGGTGTVLYEIAGQSQVSIHIEQENIPVSPQVKGICGMLGLDPMYLACEGRLVIFCSHRDSEKIIEELHKYPESKDARIIGHAEKNNPGRVILKTELDTETLLPPPTGELLPRIC